MGIEAPDWSVSWGPIEIRSCRPDCPLLCGLGCSPRFRSPPATENSRYQRNMVGLSYPEGGEKCGGIWVCALILEGSGGCSLVLPPLPSEGGCEPGHGVLAPCAGSKPSLRDRGGIARLRSQVTMSPLPRSSLMRPLLPTLCRTFGRKWCAPSAWITSRMPCRSAVGTSARCV